MNHILHEYGYGIFAAVGVIMAIAYVIVRLKQEKRDLSLRRIIFFCSTIALGSIFGGKIVFGLSLLPQAIKDGNVAYAFEKMLTGGIVYYGGLIGGLLATMIASKLEKLPFDTVANDVTPAIPLFHTFGRIGCICAGCCYGKAASWGIVFASVDKNKRIPTQLYEVIFNVVIFFVLIWLLNGEKKKKIRILPIYLISYATFRFLIEFWRGDVNRGFFGPLSTSQWISIFLFVGAILHLALRKVKDESVTGGESETDATVETEKADGSENSD